MIHVSLELQHEGEVHLFQQFTGFLRQARAQWAAQGGFDAAPGDLGGAPAPAEPQGLRLVDDAGNPMPPVEPTEPAKGITAQDMEDAVTEHAKKHGVPATLAVLQKYGVKRVTDIQPADITRAYAELWS